MSRFQKHGGFEAGCRFCGFLNGGGRHSLVDTPWLENDNYAAFVSIGALVPGWSLIAPKAHRLNLADDYAVGAFWSFAADAYSMLTGKYGNVSIFEHGAFSQASATSCGTAHAHLHMVPLQFSLFAAAQKFDPEINWVSCAARDIASVSSGCEYLFVSDCFQGSNTQGKLAILTDETSQFFRRVVAAELGIPEDFDYKLNKHMDVSAKSAQALGVGWRESRDDYKTA